MRRRWLIGALFIAGVAGAAGAAVYRGHEGLPLAYSSAFGIQNGHEPTASAIDSDGLGNTIGSTKRAPIPVRVAKVTLATDVTTPRSLTGTVRGRYETAQAFRVNGKIQRREVEVGHRVQAGQLLFELEADDYQLQLKAAQAALQVAAANVIQTTADEKRQRLLVQTNAISDSEYERTLSARDAALGQQENAQRQCELAQNQLEYCQLKADVSGIVTAIGAEVGQVVAVGSAVCSIVQDDPLEAVVDIPENRLAEVNQSLGELEVNASFWSLPGVTCKARLREVTPIADAQTRTYRSRFTLISPPPQVKLGMTATVDMKTASVNALSSDSLFMVPSSALFQKENQPAVWVVCEAEGKLEPVKIELVKMGLDHLIVKGPLAQGQMIVSAGAHMLDASARVRVWERQP